jgi:anhydro-N-acetylmuramic acid kinase
MTGTSIDAIDVALVQIRGTGLGMHAEFQRGLSRDLGPLQLQLRQLADQVPMSAGAIATIMRDFAMRHVDAIRDLLEGERCDLICVHGQTIYHKPPVSWQLMQPAPIAHAIGAPVVFDLRQADLALGGQGAPITPIADWILFGDQPEHRAIVNLGGFCNITLLPPATNSPPEARVRGVSARDVCACNQLLDAVARDLLGAPCDRDGAAALRGTPHDAALSELSALLSQQTAEGRSLGTGDELAAWIRVWRDQVTAQDLAASACAAIAIQIGRVVAGCKDVLLAGGGLHNLALVRAIEQACAGSVTSTQLEGVPPAFREAIGFAVLGALAEDRMPISLADVTRLPAGVLAPIAGAWVYPPAQR